MKYKEQLLFISYFIICTITILLYGQYKCNNPYCDYFHKCTESNVSPVYFCNSYADNCVDLNCRKYHMHSKNGDGLNQARRLLLEEKKKASSNLIHSNKYNYKNITKAKNMKSEKNNITEKEDLVNVIQEAIKNLTKNQEEQNKKNAETVNHLKKNQELQNNFNTKQQNDFMLVISQMLQRTCSITDESNYNDLASPTHLNENDKIMIIKE